MRKYCPYKTKFGGSAQRSQLRYTLIHYELLYRNRTKGRLTCNMTTITLVEREMTEAEFSRMNAGFDEHSMEYGNPVYPSQRFTFVAMDGKIFVGCASGLTNDNGQWLILTTIR